MIGIEAIMSRGNGKKKRSWSPAKCLVRNSLGGGLNNLLVTCELLNKGRYKWPLCKKTQKYKKYISKTHEMLDFSKAKKKNWWCRIDNGIGAVAKKVKIVEVASLANENVFY